MYVDVLGCRDAGFFGGDGLWNAGGWNAGVFLCVDFFRSDVDWCMLCLFIIILCPANETINYITIAYNAFINRNEYLVSQRFVLN